MTEPTDPQFNVREFSGADDGSRDTEAIQTALDECAASGGCVVVPAGEYVTAPLTVRGNTTVWLAPGAWLRFVRDWSAFPTVESRWEGWNQAGFHPCLWVTDAESVEITGHGTIDGQGDYWWQFHDESEEELPETLAERLAQFRDRNDKRDSVSSFTLRPPLLQIHRSNNVTVSGVTLRNSPFWNTHVVYSDNVTIHDVTVENPPQAPNGDGIDIDSSQHVRVSDTHITAGDDAICIKSGKNEEGRQVGRPAAQITVTNCTIEAGHGGVVIGSEMSGDVRDVVVSNCTFTDTDRGIRIKTTRGRGGRVEDLRFGTLIMRRVACPFVINGHYFTAIDSDPIPTNEETPVVNDIHFHDITARNVESAGFLAGLPEQRFGSITFTNVEIDATRPLDATERSPAMADGYEQRHGLFCRSAGDVTLTNVRIQAADTPTLAFEATDTVTVDGLRTGNEPLTMWLHDVSTTLVRGCDLLHDDTEIRASGEQSMLISGAGNHGALTDRLVSDASDIRIEPRG